jgi:hypothetical protein
MWRLVQLLAETENTTSIKEALGRLLAMLLVTAADDLRSVVDHRVRWAGDRLGNWLSVERPPKSWSGVGPGGAERAIAQTFGILHTAKRSATDALRISPAISANRSDRLHGCR